jgi:hypothetical protein
MIALISSTIYPLDPTEDTLYRGSVSHRQRLQQTIDTVNSLVRLNFQEIYLFDNSGFNWNVENESLLYPAKIIKFNSFQFTNKGLSEIYMLLSGLSVLPENTAIFKISGRYTLQTKIDENILKTYDFAGKICHQSASISTRGYYIKNKKTLELTLLSALNYIYSYPSKVVGPRSLKRIIKNAFFLNLKGQTFYDPTLSVEWGMYKALTANFKVANLDKLFLQGISAGPSGTTSEINE